MLLEVLETKHRLRVIPALPGVRPVDITAKRLERIMRFGNGVRNRIHARRPWWTTAIIILGAIVILPGAARVIGQDAAATTTMMGSDPGLKVTANESHPFSKNVNYARQITLETRLVHLSTKLLEELNLPWDDEAIQCSHCLLDEHATEVLMTSLAGNEKVVCESAPKITLFDGSDWEFEQSDQRTFVTAWEPFPGQEDQPVRTLAPVTEEVKFGFHVNGNVRCLNSGSDIQLAAHTEISSISSVETSSFHFENDIGGEPHPVQKPKIEKWGQSVGLVLPLHASLVMRHPGQGGKTTLTVLVCRMIHETPEEAVKVAGFLANESSPPSDDVTPIDAKLTITKGVERVPMRNVYVDSGLDFTPEQIELIASRHDRLGFESVQIRDGRLRVHPQALAHVATVRAMVEAERPENRPLLRGAESDEVFDYLLLTTAMQSCDIPCRIEGQVDYTINRDCIELSASPIEISYADVEESFGVRADRGEIRILLNASGDGVFSKFSGSVVIGVNDLKIAADAVEMDETGCTLRGNIVLTRGSDQAPLRLTADKLWIDPAWDSIDEIIKNLSQFAP